MLFMWMIMVVDGFQNVTQVTIMNIYWSWSSIILMWCRTTWYDHPRTQTGKLKNFVIVFCIRKRKKSETSSGDDDDDDGGGWCLWRTSIARWRCKQATASNCSCCLSVFSLSLSLASSRLLIYPKAVLYRVLPPCIYTITMRAKEGAM